MHKNYAYVDDGICHPCDFDITFLNYEVNMNLNVFFYRADKSEKTK